jgi:hypothetical protein
MSPDQSGIASSEAQSIVAPADDVTFHWNRVVRRHLFLKGMSAAGIEDQPKLGRLGANPNPVQATPKGYFV